MLSLVHFSRHLYIRNCNQDPTLNSNYNHAEEKHVVVPAGIEPATLSVWRTRDNHYTKEPCWLGGKFFV